MTTKSYISLGTAPYGEDCAQTIDPDYFDKVKDECKKFIKLLMTKFPNIPNGCRYGIKNFEHDFGLYKEVVLYYDDNNDEHMNYMISVESNLPELWE